MIKALLFENAEGCVFGFQIEDHGEGIVCSAVSMLAFNTINSIEAFTGEDFVCDYPDKGDGHITFRVPSLMDGPGGETKSGAGLLLASLALGLRSIAEEYPDQITIKEVKPDENNTDVFRP